ncbi:recombinase family protein [bacterium]|nr:recombinase family protein [bacterium]
MRTNDKLEPGTTVAIYSRMAAIPPGHNDSPSPHEKAVRDYCARCQLKIHDHYCDDGQGGHTTGNRPAFQRMMADAAAGKFTAVIVTDYARLSRNYEDAVRLSDELKRCGVVIVPIIEPFDTSTPM